MSREEGRGRREEGGGERKGGQGWGERGEVNGIDGRGGVAKREKTVLDGGEEEKDEDFVWKWRVARSAVSSFVSPFSLDHCSWVSSCARSHCPPQRSWSPNYMGCTRRVGSCFPAPLKQTKDTFPPPPPSLLHCPPSTPIQDTPPRAAPRQTTNANLRSPPAMAALLHLKTWENSGFFAFVRGFSSAPKSRKILRTFLLLFPPGGGRGQGHPFWVWVVGGRQLVISELFTSLVGWPAMRRAFSTLRSS